MINIGIANKMVSNRNDTIFRTKPNPPLSIEVPRKIFDRQVLPKPPNGTNPAKPSVQTTMSAAFRFCLYSSNAVIKKQHKQSCLCKTMKKIQ
jgi:hypothetical protein